MKYEEILKSYRVTKSMRKTALELNVSAGVVRKTLITAGFWSSPLIQRISELSAVGMPQKDIAEMLHISISTVNANTPYTRGTYLDDNKSINALRIAKCRAGKKPTAT